jgi:hypothetical protein
MLSCTATLIAQPQEGSISYRIDIDGLDAQTKSMMQNMMMTMTFKEKKSRVDMDMGMVKNTTITNGDNTYSLMDYMGSKFKIPMSKEDVKSKKMNEADYDIEYTKDTKQIAGYTCKKAIIKTKDKNVFNIWYSDALFPNASEQTQYTKFKGGCPLEFDMAQNGMKMKLTATKVELGNVSDKVFDIPDGYQEVTFEQLMQMMGGMKPKN